MNVRAFMSTIALLAGSAAVTANLTQAQETRRGDRNGEQQHENSQQSGASADDRKNDAEDRHDQQQADHQQAQQGQHQERTQYTGRERAALGVMLSEADQGQVHVSEVVQNSPAQQAGLRAGDQIRKIDGEQVNSYRDVVRAINRKHPNDQVQITVDRNGREQELNVALQQRQDVFEHEQQFGERTRDRRDDREAWQQNQRGRTDVAQNERRYDGQARRQYQYEDRRDRFDGERDERTARREDGRNERWQDENRRSWRDAWQGRERDERASLGVGIRNERGAIRVTQVYQGSAAEQAGIRRGDQIEAIDGQQVRSYGQLVDRLDEYQPGQRVSIEVSRNGQHEQVRARLQDGDAQARQMQQAQRDAREDAGHRYDRRSDDFDQQRTGRREWEADRKQTGEAHDGEPNDESDIEFDNRDF